MYKFKCRKFFVIVWLLILSTTIQTFAQGFTVTGTVTDDAGEPLPGVSVIVRGTITGTTTNADGRYSVNVPDGEAVLVFTFVGYATQTILAGTQNIVNVTMSEEAAHIEELVVVGYGTQRRINMTGAISTVAAQELENRPITNATQALQGVQGLYVNQAGGQPGSDGVTIRIRGTGTLNNSDPLILVNGIEYPLGAINPNDIESITVLKDAASSAIYGSRAANGVILIKTKEGGGAFTVNYNNYFGFQRATYLPDFVYDPIVFMENWRQAQLNVGELNPHYTLELIEEYRDGMINGDPYVYPVNNWLDIMYNDAFITEHNFRFSGGEEKYNYSLSLGYGYQDGVLRGTDSDRFTLGLNTSTQVTKRLRIGVNIQGHYLRRNAPVAGVPNLVEMTYKAQAFHPTYLEDGRYADTFVRSPGHNIYRHPLALADEGTNKHTNQRVLANLSAAYQLPFNINYNLQVAIAKTDVKNVRFAPDVYHYQVKTLAETRVSYDGVNTRHTRNEDENNLNKTIFNTLSWGEKFDKHETHLLLGYSYEDFFSSNFWAQREGYLGNELQELAAGSTNPTVGGNSSKSVLMSYFGRANYVYDNRYLFEANFRYDGSSRFAKGNRWGFFPSFSAGWRISEEEFMKDILFVNNLKIRASWGQLGNQRIALFSYVDLVNTAQRYPFNGTPNPGAAVTAYNDPNISWETTTISNLGVDASIYKGKIDLTFELFNKRTSDILRRVALPQQVGNLSGPMKNIGVVDNKGFEVGLRYRERLGAVRFDLFGNVTYIKNEVVDLGGQTIISGMNILQEGYPIDSYYMLNAIGIFQSQEEIDNSPFQTAATRPGYLKFENVNDEDNVIDEYDRKILGSIIPKYTYTFGFNVSFKQFSLDAFFQGVSNVYTYGDRIGATPFWFGCGLPRNWLTDSWTPERGTSASLPILTRYEDALNENFRTNSFWLRDASYLRLKNVQLTYELPSNIFGSSSLIKQLRFFVNGQNLLTFSKMKDFDPEKNLSGDSYYAFPSVLMVTGGFNITF